MNFVILPRQGILLHDDGFSLRKGSDELFSMKWQDIREVVAFKRDELTSDCICLSFRASSGDEYFEVNEEMEGFILLSVEMMRHIPSISPDWFDAVMQPPFATSSTRLFGDPPPVG